MASLLLFKNPLKPADRELVALEPGERPIDWLQKHYPEGFGAPIDKYLINGVETPIDDLDYMPAENDNIAIVVGPGAMGAMLLPMLMNIIMSLVMSLISMLFAPKPEKEKKKKDAPATYNVSSAQNEAKLGEPVPVLYGTMRWSPDYSSQPYTWYKMDNSKGEAGKELSLGIQYLDVILCLGSGVVEVHDIFVGETNVNVLGAELVEWKVYQPKDHKRRMGVVGATFKPSLHENVFTSPEVSNQEFTSDSDDSGPFILCKRGQRGRTIQNDVVFQQGLYKQNSDGDTVGMNCELEFIFQEFDDFDNPIGAVSTKYYRVSTKGDGSHPFISGNYPDNSPYQNAATRITFTDVMPHAGRWGCRLNRLSAENGVKKNNTFMWTGCKLFLDYTDQEVYGDVTLLACRIKASRGLGNDAAVRVVVQASKRIKDIVTGMPESMTNSPADAFYDIYINDIYGAGRPETELDMVKLKQLKKLWGNTYQFNHVFDKRITVWQALTTATTPVIAEPVPIGATMSVAQDGVKALRSMLFNDTNIVRDTLKLSYNFNTQDAPDGVEIEYLDPIRYKPAFVRVPAASHRPERFKIDGITKDNHAEEYAIVLWQRKFQQRMNVEFETELEGLIVTLGERIGISTHVPRWGQSGFILDMQGNVLSLDLDLDWSGGPHFIMLRRPDGSCTDPLPVTQGSRANKVVLGAALSFTPQFNGILEFTSYTFGELQRMVKDFIVTSIKPGSNNNRVRIEGMVYRPTIFDGGMPYLGGTLTTTVHTHKSGAIPLRHYQDSEFLVPVTGE